MLATPHKFPWHFNPRTFRCAQNARDNLLAVRPVNLIAAITIIIIGTLVLHVSRLDAAKIQPVVSHGRQSASGVSTSARLHGDFLGSTVHVHVHGARVSHSRRSLTQVQCHCPRKFRSMLATRVPFILTSGRGRTRDWRYVTTRDVDFFFHATCRPLRSFFLPPSARATDGRRISRRPTSTLLTPLRGTSARDRRRNAC